MGAAGRCCHHWEFFLFQPCEETPSAAPGGLLGWDLPSALPSALTGVSTPWRPPHPILLQTHLESNWEPTTASWCPPGTSQSSPTLPRTGRPRVEKSGWAIWLSGCMRLIQALSNRSKAAPPKPQQTFGHGCVTVQLKTGTILPRYLLGEQICVCDGAGMGKGWMKGSSRPEDTRQDSRSQGSWAAGAVINKKSILLSPIPQPVWLGGVQHD